MVVLSADHDGEGGTFAIYALLCRYIGIRPAEPSRVHRDAREADGQQGSFRGMETGDSQSGPEAFWAAVWSPAAVRRRLDESWERLPAWLQFLRAKGVGEPTRRFFRHSIWAQLLLLGVTLLSTGMVIGDGEG